MVQISVNALVPDSPRLRQAGRPSLSLREKEGNCSLFTFIFLNISFF